MEYADVNEPLPDFSPYRAIIVRLSSDEMERPRDFLPWLKKAMDSGVRLILPNGLHASHAPGGEPVHQDLVNDIFAAFGLAAASYEMPGNLDDSTIRNLKPGHFHFETSLVSPEMLYPVSPVLRQTRDGADVWQRIETVGDPERYAVSVAVGEPGFLSLHEDLLYYSIDIPNHGYRVSWNINPFAVLKAVLDCDDMPRPDVTTFWGARGAYSHVDVDGPYNMSQPDVPGPSRFALRVALDEVWKQYPFPVTLGWIAAEYDPDIDLRFIMPGETSEQALARDRLDWERPHREVAEELRKLVDEVYRLPHIQSGCHGYSHPLFWQKLQPGYAIKGYSPSYEFETRGAVEYLNRHVLPPDRPVELFQWTGDCMPPEEPFAVLKDMGMANINGGDPMYDGLHQSLYYICPLSRPVGPYRQIHTAGSNENIYTRGWIGYKGAYNNLIETFIRSEKPRRLLPVNIYYHVFPAESLQGYLAIQHVYEWAARQELCWITALEYVKSVEGFFQARIGRLPDAGWWVEDYGSCTTVRFDDESREVDLSASRNVAGWTHYNGSLYVSLMPGKRAEVVLGTGDSVTPYLAMASGMVDDITVEPNHWRARVKGWGPGFVEIRVPDGEWRGAATLPAGRSGEGIFRSHGDGRVRLDFPDAAGGWVEVVFEK